MPTFSKLSLSPRAPALTAAIAALVFVLFPVFSRAFTIWLSDPYMNAGLAIPPIAVGLVWWKRAPIRASAARGHASGLVLALGALVLLVVSERLFARTPSAIAAGLLVSGLVAFFWGWPVVRQVVFPISLVTISLTIQPTLLSGLGFALQGVTAVGSATVAHILGLPVILDGLLLRAPTYTFIVSEACSGMNSLIALLLMAIVWTSIARGGNVARGMVMVAVLPLVVISNTTRVSMVLLVADRLGQDAALGFFHGASSLVLFGLAFSGLALVSKVVGCRAPLVA
jgi:exosortase